ncbi:MAG: PsbP-related protein [Candidatus Taylorbacteria bacterium]
MNYKKGIAPLIIALIVAVILGGGFMAYKISQKTDVTPSPTQNVIADQNQTDNETKDWKTYKNEQYGFEFKYPKDWIIENNDIYDGGVAVWSSKAEKQAQKELKESGLLGGPNGADFGVHYCDDVCIQGIRDDWKDSGFGDANAGVEDIFRDRYGGSFEEIKVDGRKVYKWTEVSSIDRYITYIPLPQGGYFLSAPENDPKTISIVQEIISTFKFTK